MGKFRQFLTELSARDTPIFSFIDTTLVNNKGFSPNLLYAFTLRRSGLRLLNRHISSNFYGVICPRHAHIFVSR